MNRLSKTPIKVMLTSSPKMIKNTSFRRGMWLLLVLAALPLWAFTPSKSFFSETFTQLQSIIHQEILNANDDIAAEQPLIKSVNRQSSTVFRPPSTVFSPCPGGSGVIGGVAFQDFNHNGDNDQTGIISGVQVAIFSCDSDGNSNLISTTTTDEEGNYFFDDLSDGETYRLQFFLPGDLDHLSPGSGSGEAGTDVQFIEAPSCDAHIGYLDINDFCEEDPFIVAACYVNGDPLAPNSGSADEEAIVAFRYSSSGNAPITKLAVAEEVGATYGLAWQKSTQRIFASAFIKRHVGLGPLGIGGLYVIDWSENTPVVSPFVDVKTIGVDAGQMISNSDRGLSANPALPNNDASAYDAVGKWGLGGMDISSDEETLWLMSLNNQTLYSIEIDSDDNFETPPTSGDVSAFPLPNGGCSGGALRPFAVKYYQGSVYVGAVCDAAASQDASNLEAIIYRLNGNSFVEELRYQLDYPKGYTTFANDCEENPGWFPWRDDLPPACSDNQIFRVYPTPVLSDLAFDTDGSLIMGFTDRMGHQIGFKNYPLEGTSPLLQTVSGGDILRAYNDNGTLVLENNATAGNLTTDGVGNGEGPGGGEFYYRDVFEGPIDNLVDPQPHVETAQGALAIVPGNGEVVTTALDPYSTLFNSGGVNWLSNTTGQERNPGFVLYRTSNTDISTFSKANGLGDIAPLCGLAPLEIGSYVWEDINENGLQDPCEPPVDNTNIALLDTEGNILAVAMTDENGEFYFNDETPDFEGIQPNTTYIVAVGTEGDFNIAAGVLMNLGTITEADVAVGGIDADLIDSDAKIANANIAGGVIAGLPFVQITTGGPGFTDHSMDIGFTSSPPPPVTVTGEVWHDEDGDGIQDANENPIEGVTVQLFTQDGTLAGTTTTNADGTYEFEVDMGGVYYVMFELNPMVGDDNFELTVQNAGDGTNDSDPDPITGQTVNFPVILNSEGVANIDAGYIRIIPASGSIGDYVFKDCNQNGIQDSGDSGIAGVAITLTHTADGTQQNTTSDANGFYVFTDLMPGTYRLSFSLPANGGLEWTAANQGGDEALDSDVNSDGMTTDIVLSEGEENEEVDAGLVDVEAPEFTGSLPQDMTVDDCDSGSLPDPPDLTAMDNCDDNVEITFDQSTDNSGGGDGCAGATIVRTWTAMDDCGNSTTHTQHITLNDTEAPSFTGQLPQDKNGGECDGGEIPPPPTLTATDNCDDDVEITFEETTSGGGSGCIGATVIRIWTATDDCGNSTTHSQTISFSDTTAPTFDGSLPQDMTMDCNDTPPSPPTLTASDNCDTDVEVTFSGNLYENANCAGGVMTRTWTATDDCGNVVTHVQTITFVDETPPEFAGTLPGDSMGEDCTVNDLPPPATLQATDDCDENVEITFDEELVGGNIDGCAGNILVRTWTATDDCGNSVSHSQTIIFGDNTPPVFTGVLPADMHGVECGDFDLNNPPTLSATDNCDPNVVVSFMQEVEDNPSDCAGGTVTRTWTATDDCGNQTTHVQTITFDDNTPPEITGVPDDVTVDCDDIPGMPIVKGIDDCGGEVELVFTETQQGDCPLIITRTWTAIDNCGNQASDSQVITVVDTVPPIVFYNNPHLIGMEDGDTLVVSCDNVPVLTNLDVSVFDNCDADLDVEFVDFIVNSSDCIETGYLAYMFCGWIVQDDCGNTAQLTIHILVVDEEPPVLVGVPDDIFIGENGEIPDIPEVTATDNCDNNVHIDFEQEVVNESCGSSVKRTWIATDDCGNQDVEVQLIIFSANCDCPAPIIASHSTQNSDCGMDNGSASITIDGDPTDYIITWTPNVGTPNATDTERTDLPPGVYSVQFEYPFAMECFEKVVFEIEGEQPENPNVGITGVTCAGDSDGSIVSQDGRIYIISQGGNEIGTSPVFNISAGTYTITYENNDGCTTAIDIVVPEPSALEVETNSASVTCAGGDGAISLTVNGGSGNYSYQWSPDVSSTSFANNLDTGTYSITVSDAENCSEVVSVQILDECSCDLTLTAQAENSTCGMANGSITVTPGGSIFGNLEYTWSPNVSSSNTAMGLGAGTYSVTVTDATSGCEATATATIEAVDLPQTPDVSVTDPSCPGVCDGVITADNNRVYTIFQNNTEIGQTPLTGLCPGTYTVRYADDNSCNVSMNVTLDEPAALSATFSSEPDSCDLGIGNIVISATGGNGTLSYAWTPDVSNGSTASGLNPGSYSVVVSDANGCEVAINNIVIGNTDCEFVCDVVVNTSTTPDSCEVGQGTIVLSVSGGATPYSYDWTPNVSSSSTASGLNAGTYSVVVTDANGCEETLSNIVIENEECEVVCDLMVSSSTTADSCEVGQGTIVLSVSGGATPYSYDWTPNVSSNSTASGLNAGTYSVVVTDANGCEETLSSISIENEDCEIECNLEISETHADAACGEDNGSIEVTVANAIGNITYNWNPDVSDEASASGLEAGVYMVTAIDDMTGCVAEIMITIEQEDMPEMPNVNITNQSCAGVLNGAITSNDGRVYTVFRGTTEIGQTPITGLGADTYTVTFTDGANCMVSLEVEVTAPAPLSLEAIATPDTCEIGNGTITLNISGGTAPYNYQWEDNISTSNVATGLSSGTYNTTVTDANGCNIEISGIPVGNICFCALEASATILPDTCEMGVGSVILQINGGTEPFTYQWSDNVSTGSTATGLSEGTYSVTATDADGCSIELNGINVINICPCSLEATATIQGTTCGESNGSISIDVVGAQGNLIYNWTPNVSDSNSASNLAGGDYTIQISDDATVCMLELNVTVNTSTGVEAPDFSVTQPACPDGANSTGSIESDDGRVYRIFDGDNFLGFTPRHNLEPGTYRVVYFATNGCSTEIETEIMGIDAWEIDIATTPADCNNNGTIEITVSGANGGYSYTWSPDVSDSHTATNLEPGMYDLTITDSEGCENVIDDIIVQDDCFCNIEIVDALIQDANCGENNGSATLQITGNNGTVTYQWSDPSTNGATADNLAADTYSVTVTDEAGCGTSTSFTIGDIPPPAEPDVLASAESCPNEGDGSIIANDNRVYTILQDGVALGTTPLTGLEARNYTVVFEDEHGCSVNLEVEVEAVEAWAVTTSTSLTSCTDDDGGISLAVEGGHGDYTYEWSEGNSGTNELLGVASGTYSVTITDSEGCSTIVEDIQVVNGCDCALSIEVTSNQYEFCGLDNGRLVVAVSGNEGELTYQWTGTNSTTNVANDLDSGDYSVTATDASTGCTISLTATVGELLPPDAPDITVIGTTCPNDEDGAIYSNDGRTYRVYENGVLIGVVPATSLSPGNYEVEFTDQNGCTVATEASVEGVDAFNVSVETSGATCSGSDGMIMLAVEGGTAPYHFVWQGNISSMNSSEAENLGAGTYGVTIVDANNCSYSVQAEVQDECGLSDCPPVVFASSLLIVEETNGIQCVPLTLSHLEGKSIYIDGELYEEELQLCMRDSIISYDYHPIFEIDENDFYEVIWEANGVTYEALVDDMYDLADLLNEWDAAGNWANDPSQHILIGGSTPFSYGEMTITHSSGTTADISPDLSGTSPGVVMDLGTDAEELVVEDSNGCADTISLVSESEVEVTGFVYADYNLHLAENQEDVIIRWVTRNETPVGRFYIEHSIDSVRFNTLPFMIEGKGPSNELNVYEATDENPHVGWNYYRVLYINARGEAFRTGILKIFFRPLDGSEVLVYPNPFRNETLLDFLNPLEEEANVQIIDGWGQILREEKVLKGEFKHILDMSQYPAGMYFIYVTYNKHRRAIHRIVKEE